MTWDYRADLSRKGPVPEIPGPSVQCIQAASPVASGDYEGAGCWSSVRARACAPTRVLGSSASRGVRVRAGTAEKFRVRRLAPSVVASVLLAAHSSGAVRRAPPCHRPSHRVVREKPLSPANKRLTIPVVRVPLLVDRQFGRQPVQWPGAFGLWAVVRAFSNSSLLCAASARSSRKTPDAATPPGRRIAEYQSRGSPTVPGIEVLRVTPTAGMVGSRTRRRRPSTVDQSC